MRKWKREKSDLEGIIYDVVDEEENLIAGIISNGQSMEQVEEDSRLLIAAPDMLEALEEIDKFVDEWLGEAKAGFFARGKVKEAIEKAKEIKAYEIGFRFTDRTDASIHSEIVEADSDTDALNILYERYGDKVIWSTVKRVKS